MRAIQELHLIPIYCSAQSEILVPLADCISHIFGVRVEQHPPRFDPEVAFDSSRGQYSSRILMSRLLATVPEDAGRILGVASVDLFMPVLTYVFGEAQLDGRAAVVSFHRLDNRVYGLPHNPGLLLRRLCKEAVHELGHTYNLLHCHNDLCVMSSSTYVEGIDLKPEEFCSSCLASLRSRIGGRSES